MVTDNHYRWDFIGLSTDDKPTPESSHKVTDGSTFYCADTSKLYVFYQDTWYERIAPGGSSIDVVDTVSTYADLESYDTSSLTDNDIIKVLNDETHGGDSSYYRYDATNDTWIYVGSASMTSYKLVTLTQSEYNATEPKDPDTYYFIIEESNSESPTPSESTNSLNMMRMGINRAALNAMDESGEDGIAPDLEPVVDLPETDDIEDVPEEEEENEENEENEEEENEESEE